MRRNAVIEQLELAFFKSPAILNQLDANGDLNLTISMDGFNDTTVTACGGAFETVCAESVAL